MDTYQKTLQSLILRIAPAFDVQPEDISERNAQQDTKDTLHTI